MQKLNAPAAETEVCLRRLDDLSDGRQEEGGPRRSFLRRYVGFFAIVVVPTLLSAVYFFGLAADRYETQAQYVVRTAGSGVGGPLQSLVQSSGVTRSTDDAYITHAYLQSRDAMQELFQRIDLLKFLGRPPLDLLWHYPPPLQEHNDERLHKRLSRHIVTTFDRSTGITTLKVQAFTPEDSQVIAVALLQNAEQLINRLSERGRRDAIASAEADVAISRKAAIEAQERLTEFRNRNSVVDPGKMSVSTQEIIARLALESAQLGAQVRATMRTSPNNPQIEADQVRIAALEEQILKERERLAGTVGSLAPLIAEYESLVLERQLTEQAFGSSLAALEAARSDALRQRLFLDQIAMPSVPDHAAYPYRTLNVAIVLAVSCAVFLLLRRLIRDAVLHAKD